jgi:hypothetical protein
MKAGFQEVAISDFMETAKIYLAASSAGGYFFLFNL